MKHAKFLKNAAVISAGGLLAKGIGVLYRIPLANLLGGYGEGLYQMAYPLFCLMLPLSSAGVSTVVARAVAARRAAGRMGGTLPAALRLFSLLGLGATALMLLLSHPVARLQGEEALVGCYLALAPAILPVAILCVLRGWWQGQGEMAPTACSEIVEQLIKAGAGLLLASRFYAQPVRAAQAALFAVALSECAALLVVAFRTRERRCPLLPMRGGELFFSALPAMTNAALLPLSGMLDSVLVVRLLARTTPRAVHLYGLFTGGALALVSLPATLCCGFVAAAVPAVSAAGGGKEGAERALTALAFTFAIALPCAAGIFLFAPVIAGLLYPALSAQDAEVLVRLLRLMCVSSAALAAVDTLAACLTAMGRAKCAMRAMLCAVLCKAALQIILVGKLGITGAAIAANGCYLVAFFLDLFYTVDTVKADRREKRHVVHHRTRNKEGGSDAGRACGASKGGRRRRAHRNAPLGGKLEGGGDRL